jgi:protein-tyrosine-phosphatase/DNA-binding transcriptional ArsR family regulator
MTTASPPDFLKLLAHDLRWQLLTLLAQSDRRVQELVAQLERPINLVSYHLRLLREAGLVQEHRSAADGRDLYYTLTLSQVADQFHAAGRQLHPALSVATLPPRQRPAHILFLCTRNSARSQMAEALLRAQAGSRPLTIESAGSHPAAVNPDAIAAMTAFGLDISGQHSKHIDQLQQRAFDYVITVCDQVREECPTFPGEPKSIHWSVPDPVAAGGTPAERLAVFVATAQALATRVEHFLLRLDTDAV